jgi:hypothetical protein
MEKLRLNPEKLVVESFESEAREPKGRGTVQANCCTCGGDTCEPPCDPSFDHVCEPTADLHVC